MVKLISVPFSAIKTGAVVKSLEPLCSEMDSVTEDTFSDPSVSSGVIVMLTVLEGLFLR